MTSRRLDDRHYSTLVNELLELTEFLVERGGEKSNDNEDGASDAFFVRQERDDTVETINSSQLEVPGITNARRTHMAVRVA